MTLLEIKTERIIFIVLFIGFILTVVITAFSVMESERKQEEAKFNAWYSQLLKSAAISKLTVEQKTAFTFEDWDEYYAYGYSPDLALKEFLTRH